MSIVFLLDDVMYMTKSPSLQMIKTGGGKGQGMGLQFPNNKG